MKRKKNPVSTLEFFAFYNVSKVPTLYDLVLVHFPKPSSLLQYVVRAIMLESAYKCFIIQACWGGTAIFLSF